MDDVCEAFEEFLQIREERSSNLEINMKLTQAKKDYFLIRRSQTRILKETRKDVLRR